MITPRPAAATAAALQSSTLSNTSCFVYGTLMSKPVLETLIGRVPKMIEPAYLPGHLRYPVRKLVFPGVIPAVEAHQKISYTPKPVSHRFGLPQHLESSMGSTYVEGVLLMDLTPEEVQVFDWYEDTAYMRSIVSVWIPSNTGEGCGLLPSLEPTLDSTSKSSWERKETNIYLWANPLSELDQDQDWDYDYFLQNNLDWYLENTVRPCRSQLDSLNIGVRPTS